MIEFDLVSFYVGNILMDQYYTDRIAKGLKFATRILLLLHLFLLLFFFWFEHVHVAQYQIVIVSLLICTASYILLQKKLLRIGVGVFIFGLWLLMTLDIVTRTGLLSISSLAQITIVILGNYILKGNKGSILTFITIITTSTIYWLEQLGYITTSSGHLMDNPRWLAYVTIIFFGGLFGRGVYYRISNEISKAEVNATRYHSLFKRSPTAILLLEDTLEVIDANPEACALLEASPKKLVGRSICDFLPQDIVRIVENLKTEAQKNNSIPRLELDITSYKGTISHVEIFGKRMPGNGVESPHIQVFIRDITDSKKTLSQITEIAMKDWLTKANNRLAFNSIINDKIATIGDSDCFSILYIDIDDFKAVNDTHGHEFGDKVLVAFVKHMNSQIRETDFFARIHGDEFILLLERCDRRGVENTIERILQSLETPFSIDGSSIQIKVSIGISCYPEDASEVADLIRKADTAMYRVKLAGKGNYLFSSKSIIL
jgi:diguanylate cyclase (GGDEF)-like protein/PAS domain S-box-containing protein